jgi:hypothetical protein
MNDDDRLDAPLNDEELTSKDTSYSPASERETAAKQDDADALPANPPGTGGPDDTGDLEVDPDELNLPGDGHAL